MASAHPARRVSPTQRALMNRLPCVVLQVEGRRQQRDPGHHCFLQSEGEAGGISGRVSAPAQSRALKSGGVCP